MTPKEATNFNSLIILGQRFKMKNDITRHITTDSHFGNEEQVRKLADLGYYCTLGVLRSTNLFKKALGFGLKKGNTRIAMKDEVIAAAHNRKKLVCLMSNAFTVANVESASGEIRSRILEHYDNTKRRTDQFNQLTFNYHYNHRHSNIKHNILIGLFECALTNAYIMYSDVEKKPVNHMAFLLSIAEHLLLSK